MLVMVLVCVLLEMHLDPHLLQMEVSIHIVLEAQHSFLTFIRAQDHIAACSPSIRIHEPETAVLIEPETLLLLPLSIPDNPLTGQLFKEGCPVIRMANEKVSLCGSVRGCLLYTSDAADE